MFKAIGHNRRGNTLRMGLLGLLIGFGLNGLCILLSVISGDIKLTFQGMDPLLLAVFLAAVLIQSSGEELVNRCFLYQKLRRRYRHPAVAILGNSLLFGIIHMTNPGASLGGLLQIIIAGLLFSLIIYYYGSFWAACGFHTGWNFTQSILFGLPNSGSHGHPLRRRDRHRPAHESKGRPLAGSLQGVRDGLVPAASIDLVSILPEQFL